MMDVQRRLEETRAIRHIEEPTSLPVCRAVTRIWHFPSGDVLLERADRRDCLIPAVERVDVPVTGVESVADAVALDTDTAVRVTTDADSRIVTEFDRRVEI